MDSLVFADLKDGDRVRRNQHLGTVRQIMGHEVTDGGCVMVVWDDQPHIAKMEYMREIDEAR